MKVVFTPEFKRQLKKLHKNQKDDLDAAVQLLIEKPDSGQVKTGDLNNIRIYKFKMVKQLTLLAYRYHKTGIVLQLIMFGSHENFYRDLNNIQ